MPVKPLMHSEPQSDSWTRWGGIPFNLITFNHFLFVPQLLQLVTVSEKRWRARSRGSGVYGWSDDGEEGFESGDCDDEDECAGVSGLGPPPRRKRLRFFAGQTNLFKLSHRSNFCGFRQGVASRIKITLNDTYESGCENMSDANY